MRAILPILLILAACSGLTALSYAQSDSSDQAQGTVTIHKISRTDTELVKFNQGKDNPVYINDNISFRISVSGTNMLTLVALDSDGTPIPIGDMSVGERRFTKQIDHLDDGIYTIEANGVSKGTITVSSAPPVSETPFSITIHKISRTATELAKFDKDGDNLVHINDRIQFRVSVTGTTYLDLAARDSDDDYTRIADKSIGQNRFTKEFAHLDDGTYTLVANTVDSGTFIVAGQTPDTVTPPDVVTPSDTIAPSISSTEFTGARTIIITLSEPVPSITGTFSQSGDAKLGTISYVHGPNTDTVTLTTTNAAVQDTPYTISYPAIADTMGNILGAGSFEVTSTIDVTPPSISSHEFTGARTITVILGEPVPRVADMFVQSGDTDLGDITSEYASATNTITLTTANAAVQGMPYTISYPAISDMSGNILDAGTFTVTGIDTTVPSISDSVFTGSNTITITLSEPVSNPTGVFTHEALGTITHTTDDMIITLTTTNVAVQGTPYTINHPAISDGRNNLVAGTFTATGIDTTAPTINSAIFTNANLITLTFSEAITLPSLGAFTAAAGQTNGQDLGTLTIGYTAGSTTLTLTPTTLPIKHDIFTIAPVGIEDIVGHALDTASIDATFTADDTTDPSIMSSAFTDARTVLITFSEPIENPTGTFTDAELGAITHVTDGMTITLTTTNAAAQDETYKISHPAISDVSGNILAPGTFDAKGIDTTPPSIKQTSFTDLQVILVTFSEPVENPTGMFTNADLGTITHVTDGASITLTAMNNSTEGTAYIISHPAISDISGNVLVAGTLDLVGSDFIAPSIMRTVFMDAKTVVITLSESVNNPTGKFTNAALGDITHVTDGVSITLTTTNDAVEGTEYTISHPAISDLSENTLKVGEFVITRPDTAPSISNTKFTNANTIVITLSEPVPSVADEFSQSEDTELGTISRAHTPDTNTVTLTTANEAVGGTAYMISHPSISDVSGNTLESGTFDITKPDITAPSISRVKFTESDTIIITLSEPVPSVTGTFSQSEGTELGAISYVHTSDTNTIILTTTNKAVLETLYTISHPAISDASDNTLESGNYDITYILSPPEISSIIFANPRAIHITFDKKIVGPTDSFTIDPELRNSIQYFRTSPSTLTLQLYTDAIPLTSYTITIPEIQGVDGFVLPSTSWTIEYTPPERQNTPKLQFAEFWADSVLYLSFDKQFAIDSFTISSELSVTDTFLGAHTHLLIFDSVPQTGSTYSVTIPELSAQDGSILPRTSYSIKYDPLPPVISSVSFSDANTITVGFDRKIISPTDSFTVSPILPITRTSLLYSDYYIRLHYTPPASAGTYELTIPTIHAQDGTIFSGASRDIVYNPPPIIQYIGFDDPNTIRIVFDKNIPAPYSSRPFTISPELPIGDVSRLEDTITLSLDSPASAGVPYNVTIPRISGPDGSTFSRTIRDIQFNPPPVIQSTEFDGPSTIRITFDKDIDRPTDAFSISPALSVTDTLVSGAILTLTLGEFADALPYTITIPEITGKDGSTLSGASQTATFIRPAPPTISSSDFTDSTTLRIVFDKALASGMIPAASSFSISPILDVTGVSADGATLTLTLGSSAIVNSYTVTIPELRGQDGSIFSSTDQNIEFVPPPPIIQSIEFIDASTIRITFDKNVDSPAANSFTVSHRYGTQSTLPVNNVLHSGSTLTINLGSPVQEGRYIVTIPVLQGQDGSSFSSATRNISLVLPPMIQFVDFYGPSTLRIMFNENVASPTDSFTISPELPITNVYRSLDTLILSLGSPARTGVMYTVTIPEISRSTYDGSTYGSITLPSTTHNITYTTFPSDYQPEQIVPSACSEFEMASNQCLVGGISEKISGGNLSCVEDNNCDRYSSSDIAITNISNIEDSYNINTATMMPTSKITIQLPRSGGFYMSFIVHSDENSTLKTNIIDNNNSSEIVPLSGTTLIERTYSNDQFERLDISSEQHRKLNILLRDSDGRRSGDSNLIISDFVFETRP